MSIELGWLEDNTNERVLDAIRWEASPDYQRRISEASQVGVERVLDDLSHYRPIWNEFESALVNKIGTTIARTKSWTNPLSEFKRGMLTHGDTIEEIEMGLLRAYGIEPRMDYGEKMLFGRELPEVQSNYHRINRQDMYKVTVNTAILRRAFLNDGGLSAYAAKLMDAPQKSDNWDEFLLMCKLFSEYESRDGFFKINVPDVANLNSTADQAKQVLRRIREMGESLSFLSTRFNAAHMPVHADINDMVLFTTPSFKAALDVNALAAAFNIEQANVPNRIITIPEAQLGIDGAQAILTSRDFFVVADTLLENTSQWNPVNLHNNYFLHHHQIISASRFVPSIMFTTKAGSEVIEVSPKVNSITDIGVFDVDHVEVENVAPGLVYSFEPTITTTPSDAKDWWRMGVRVTVSGAVSPRTYVSDNGVLRVGGDETTASLTVTAFDVNDDAVTMSVAVPVVGKTVPSWPAE